MKPAPVADIGTVTFPELIAQTNMDQTSVNKLKEELMFMTAWLGRTDNVKKYFSEEYQDTSQEYQDRAKGGVTVD